MLPVGGGRDAVSLVEGFPEVADAAEAAGEADIGDPLVGVGQLLGGAL